MRSSFDPTQYSAAEMAEYMSAYEVADEMIGEVESLLIRAFPNELMNKKVENFTWE